MSLLIGLVIGLIFGGITVDWVQLRLDTVFGKRIVAKTERKVEALRLYKLRYETIRDLKKSVR